MNNWLLYFCYDFWTVILIWISYRNMNDSSTTSVAFTWGLLWECCYLDRWNGVFKLNSNDTSNLCWRCTVLWRWCAILRRRSWCWRLALFTQQNLTYLFQQLWIYIGTFIWIIATAAAATTERATSERATSEWAASEWATTETAWTKSSAWWTIIIVRRWRFCYN